MWNDPGHHQGFTAGELGHCHQLPPFFLDKTSSEPETTEGRVECNLRDYSLCTGTENC